MSEQGRVPSPMTETARTVEWDDLTTEQKADMARKRSGRVQTPAYCAIHQHYKWCKHNGGCGCRRVPGGYHSPEAHNKNANAPARGQS